MSTLDTCLILVIVALLAIAIAQHRTIEQLHRRLLGLVSRPGPDDDDDGEPLQLPLAENDDDVRKLKPGMLYQTREGVIHVRRRA